MGWFKKDSKDSYEGENGAAQSAPRLSLQEITFSDGVRLQLQKNSILIVTGPNNTGKSSVLREIRDYFIEGNTFGPVVSSAKIRIDGELADFRKVIDDMSVPSDWPGSISIEGMRYDLDSLEKHYKQAFRGCRASKAFFSHLAAGERLALTEPAKRDDYSIEAPHHPLQLLDLDSALEHHLCDEFERTFKMKLALNRLRGAYLTLHTYHPELHEAPPEGGMRARAKWLGSLPGLHRQGDGMRSYAGTLLALKVHPKRLVLLDEPEAFLHPPQTRKLGSLVSADKLDMQLIVATHSDEFIRSVLDSAGDRVTIIRIERSIGRNKITVLNASDIQRLWTDPLLRTSDLLSSLFHEVAAICEGDSDARFYRALLEATEVDDQSKDVRFFHLGGKDRIPSIVSALRAVGVPVVVVVDIDILSDRQKFFDLFERLGGDKDAIEDDLSAILTTVMARKGQLTATELASELNRIASELKDSDEISKDARRKITQLGRVSSNWQRIKEDGYRGFVDATSIRAFERIAAASKQVGLLINREGELEGFARDISRTRKSDWLMNVLQRDLAQDSALAAAREFAIEIRDCFDVALNRSQSN